MPHYASNSKRKGAACGASAFSPFARQRDDNFDEAEQECAMYKGRFPHPKGSPLSKQPEQMPETGIALRENRRIRFTTSVASGSCPTSDFELRPTAN